MGATVGIDLGTTNSVIARIDKQGKPVVIPNAEGNPITPSVICFQDAKILIGDTAKEIQALGTWPIAAFFKRQMGDPLFIFYANGKDYSATDLAAMILRKLKTDAEAHIGTPITRAVVTVPAYFRDVERKATIAAGVAAGLDIIQVINEPTAAAIAYGLAHRHPGDRLLVYDLGGGTFDITLLELTKEGVKVCTSDGNHQLGGKDWDDRIIEFLASSFQSEFGSDPLDEAESLAALLIQAETAKKHLTAFDTTTITITHHGNCGRYQLSRAKFVEITADLLERTIILTKRVLEDMRLRPKDINGVLLVGGSTRMPMIHDFVIQTFGRPPLSGINVDEAVALGAAVVAAERVAEPTLLALRGPIKTVDVTNHSLGMIAINADHSAYINSIILPKNMAIPCTETRPYQRRTSSRGDNTIEIFMTQGEMTHPAEVSYVGKYVIHTIPHQRTGITVVNVTYHYDHSGTVKVTARVKDTTQDLFITVEDLPADVPARFLQPPEPLLLPQHITVYLAFDLSGSMSGPPLVEAKKAAHGFLRNIDLTNCSIGIIAFSDTVRIKLKACQNASEISKTIDKLDAGETGYCNDAHPFDEILHILPKTDGRNLAVVLADGVWAKQDLAIKQAQACHAAGIDIIAIGFGSADSKFLRSIASSDETNFFTSINGLVETFSTIAQVLTGSAGAAIANKGRTKRLGFLSSILGR